MIVYFFLSCEVPYKYVVARLFRLLTAVPEFKKRDDLPYSVIFCKLMFQFRNETNYIGRKIMTHDREFSHIATYIIEHRSELLHYANMLTHYCTDDADDLFQETVYRSLHNANTYHERGTTDAWLKTIMRNIYLNDVNRSAHRYASDTDRLEVVDEDMCPDEIYSIGELYRAISMLSKRDNKIITMRLQGYSYAEIAQRMDMKEGTVKSALHRIKVQLRKLLE